MIVSLVHSDHRLVFQQIPAVCRCTKMVFPLAGLALLLMGSIALMHRSVILIRMLMSLLLLRRPLVAQPLLIDVRTALR